MSDRNLQHRSWIKSIRHIGHFLISSVIIIDEPLPEPVLLPHSLRHLFNRDILCLGYQEKHEHRHDQDPPRKEQEDAELEVAEHGEEGLRNDEGEEQVDANGDTLSGGTSLQWESLTGNKPPERTPRPCKRRHESAHQNHHQHCKTFRKVVGIVLHLYSQYDGYHHLRQKHLHTSFQQQKTTSQFVDGVDRNNGGEHVDSTGYHGGIEGCIAPESYRVEQHRSIKHDCVDARELLEYLFQQMNELCYVICFN